MGWLLYFPETLEASPFKFHMISVCEWDFYGHAATKTHYNDVIWARWRLRSPASRLFIKPFIQAQIKENIKAPRHWPFCAGYSPVTDEFPAQKASNAENVSI